MKHRLFHTLVLSSAALIEGCGTATRNGSERAQVQPAPTDAPVSGSEVAVTTDAAARADAVAQGPSADEIRAMVADARACSESGWSTTKSAGSVSKTQVSHEGRSYWCLPEHLQRTPRCCLQSPTP